MRRSSKPLPKDPNQLAHEIVRLSTEEPEETTQADQPEKSAISQYLSKIGRTGGLKGGIARSKKLTKKRKAEIARKAAKARWNKK